ncbi:MAG TPA: Calx-beta domain-containing protein, partial [Isosphaeraceae bacterium]
MGNGVAGLFLNGASDNTIGGTADGTGNLISGNGNIVVQSDFRSGIVIFTNGGRRNVIQGNLIGTDASGTRSLGNGVSGSGAGIDIFGDTSGNTIGGVEEGARNVISGNFFSGVRISNAGDQGNVIQGNYIGTDISGTISLANGLSGIELGLAVGNTIGGTIPEARNLVSGNGTFGILLANSSGNLVQGNYVGVDITGTTTLGNVEGVRFQSSSSNTLGGTTAGARNLFSGNGGDGVRIIGSGA